MKNRSSFFLAITLLVAGACSTKLNGEIVPAMTDSVTTYFPGEIKPGSHATCALGAYYYKIISSPDVWRGITGTVVLPHLTFDSSRKRPTNNQQFLDNPSVYLGGNAGGQETDIGVTWEVIKDASGNVSQDRRAFRPFLRRAGYSATRQAALYVNAPAIPAYYWYPGETVTMTVKIVSDGLLQFTAQGANKTFDTTFAADGYKLKMPATFKRVNAIDQVSNEGRPVQPTKMQVSGAQWTKTALLRFYNNAVAEAPTHPGRYTLMLCPDPKYFTITATEEEAKKGAVKVAIDAGK